MPASFPAKASSRCLRSVVFQMTLCPTTQSSSACASFLPVTAVVRAGMACLVRPSCALAPALRRVPPPRMSRLKSTDELAASVVGTSPSAASSTSSWQASRGRFRGLDLAMAFASSFAASSARYSCSWDGWTTREAARSAS
eukprot:scaffold22086_cov28-Tisochrysis_lutea.AAC.4